MRIIGGILGMLVSLLVGLFLGVALYQGVTKFVAERDLSTWTSTQGSLSRLWIEPAAGGYVVSATYSYTVDNERYSSSDYEHSRRNYFPTQEEARNEASQTLGLMNVKWSTGRGGDQAQLTEKMTHVNVYYHPAYPFHSVLRQYPVAGGEEANTAQMTVIAIFAVLTLLCAAGFLLSARRLLPQK